mmetsp:Transcript_35129/g.70246  ORF Transcript_35129/g.70246 Transcript_35129/m.70246 type:complete len:104 (-) Transcript_35129:535-846(-)
MCTKLWGTLSDKYGRIPFMLFSSAGVSLGWMTVVYAAASHNMVLLYSGRMLDACMQPLCQSAVKESEEGRRGHGGSDADLERFCFRLQGARLCCFVCEVFLKL